MMKYYIRQRVSTHSASYRSAELEAGALRKHSLRYEKDITILICDSIQLPPRVIVDLVSSEGGTSKSASSPTAALTSLVCHT